MNEQTSLSEYLVISRGQWDKNLSREEIQNAIDQFYVWLARLVDEGKMKTGQRLASTGKTVSRKNVTDGPFGGTKEVIGGYWFIVASNLEEAAKIAAGNPVSKLWLVLRDPAHRSGASLRLHSDDRDPTRTERLTVTARDIDNPLYEAVDLSSKFEKISS
jgi:hypothetical protein